MARGTSLATIRTMLKAQVGASLDSGATGDDSALNSALSTQQKWLASEYDWPFLKRKWDLAIVAGTRYYTLPTTADAPAGACAINFERPVEVATLYNDSWCPVDFGISTEEYNDQNSDDGDTQDPIQRWDFATNVTEPGEGVTAGQIEVWPVPASSQTLRFTGQRALDDFAADGDLADLDDLLLVLFTAAEILAREDHKDAPAKLQRAQQRLLRLRAVYPSAEVGPIYLGRIYPPRRKVPYIGPSTS